MMPTQKVSKETPLLDYLKEVYPDSSMNTLREWILHKRVLVNDNPVTQAKSLVQEGDVVRIGHKTRPLTGDITILYEDHDLIVIDKPEGLLSVSTEKEEVRTAHNNIKRNHRNQRVYPVHRLDRETSGVMVFAYSKLAKDHLKEQFECHSIDRAYLAIIEGHPKEDKGTWESYLYDDPNFIVRETTDKELGKLSITHYEVIKSLRKLCLVKMTLKTGRKNQIRVQSASSGHPVIGDKKYGSTIDPIKRLGLHAYTLSFTHPKTQKRLSFTSYIPEEFQHLFKIQATLPKT